MTINVKKEARENAIGKIQKQWPDKSLPNNIDVDRSPSVVLSFRIKN